MIEGSIRQENIIIITVDTKSGRPKIHDAKTDKIKTGNG